MLLAITNSQTCNPISYLRRSQCRVTPAQHHSGMNTFSCGSHRLYLGMRGHTRASHRRTVASMVNITRLSCSETPCRLSLKFHADFTSATRLSSCRPAAYSPSIFTQNHSTCAYRSILRGALGRDEPLRGTCESEAVAASPRAFPAPNGGLLPGAESSAHVPRMQRARCAPLPRCAGA